MLKIDYQNNDSGCADNTIRNLPKTLTNKELNVMDNQVLSVNRIESQESKPAHNRKDLTGLIFGRWTVLRFHSIRKYSESNKDKKAMYLCECECGNRGVVCGNSLSQGNSKSCGCLNLEKIIERNRTHGKTGIRVYRIWQAMLTRCRNINVPNYNNYGGRGISVCKRWESFENFLKDMGNPKPNESIERIDNDGNYNILNCKWATKKEQSRNTRSNRKISFRGETLCLCEWAKRLKIDQASLRERLEKWSLKDALTKPKNERFKK